MPITTLRQKLSGSFPALQHRNFRLFWFGQCISLIGTWMQNIGQAWLVLQLTNSSFKLGLVSALQFLPMLLFALFTGTLADRFPKRRVLICTQISLLIQALILATLTYFKVVQYWHVLVLALLLGLVNALDMPTRQAYFVELVGKENLMNAIALNSTIFNLARILGPALAGLMIHYLGIGICFYLNALSFLAVITGLWLIGKNTQDIVREGKDSFQSVLRQSGEGFNYVISKPLIMFPLILLGVISIFVINFNVFVPIVAKIVLKQDAQGFGILMTFMGIGALIAALTMAARSKAGPRLPILLGASLFLSLLLVLLGFSFTYIMAASVLLLMGFCTVTFSTSINTMIQLQSDDRMRGRVMGFFSLVFGGMTPVGSLLLGILMEKISVSMGMVICGICGILSTIVVGGFMLKHSGKQSKLSKAASQD